MCRDIVFVTTEPRNKELWYKQSISQTGTIGDIMMMEGDGVIARCKLKSNINGLIWIKAVKFGS